MHDVQYITNSYVLDQAEKTNISGSSKAYGVYSGNSQDPNRRSKILITRASVGATSWKIEAKVDIKNMPGVEELLTDQCMF